MTAYDSTWKDALETYFEAFMELLFPDVHAVVDWDRPAVFRDKELQKMDPLGATGVRTVVKLIDFERGWDDLIASENPFAVVVQAHLKALRTRGRPLERKEWKLAIMRRLYDRGVGGDDIRMLFRFIDGLMTLPRELDRIFLVELEQIEEEKDMPYVTSIERIGIEKGLERGRKEGELRMARKNILDALEVRFEDVPSDVRKAIDSLKEPGSCHKLLRAAILADSMRDFEARLAELTADGN